MSKKGLPMGLGVVLGWQTGLSTPLCWFFREMLHFPAHSVTVTHISLSLVPDAPINLQLSLKKEAEGVVMCWWSPPVNAHGLIREFIVSPAGTWGQQHTASCRGWWAWNERFWGGNLLGTPGKLGEEMLQAVGSTTALEFLMSPFLRCCASLC